MTAILKAGSNAFVLRILLKEPYSPTLMGYVKTKFYPRPLYEK